MSEQETGLEEFEGWGDDRVWQAFMEGRDEAVYELMNRHGDALHRYLLLSTGRARNAAQMSGEAWALATAWRNPFEGFGSFREWIFAVATQNLMPPTQPDTAGLGEIIDEFAGREAGAGLGAVVYRVVALLRHLRVPLLLRVSGFNDAEIGRICNFTEEKAGNCVRKACRQLASEREFHVEAAGDEQAERERIIQTLRELDLPAADAALLEYVHRHVAEALQRKPKMPHPPADPEPESSSAWKAAVILGALVAVLFLLLGGLAYLARDYEPPPSVGELLDRGGVVTVKDYQTRDPRTMEEDQPLVQGMTLKTERDARLALRADTAVLHMDEGTEVGLGPAGGYALAMGRIMAEHTGDEAQVEVRTAPAVVCVRGGRAVVQSHGEWVNVFCISGAATLGRTGEQDVELEPGQAGRAGRGGLSRTVRPFQRDFHTQWLRRFATQPGGPRSYDELISLPVTPNFANRDEALESVDLRVTLDGPIASVEASVVPALSGSERGMPWVSTLHDSVRILTRHDDVFRMVVSPPYQMTGQIDRLSLTLPGMTPEFSGGEWERRRDTWTARNVNLNRDIILEFPAEEIAARGAVPPPENARRTVLGHVPDYEEDEDLERWLPQGANVILVFDRASFEGPRQYVRAYLMAEYFLRALHRRADATVIDSMALPELPGPSTSPRVDRLTARLWEDPARQIREGMLDLMNRNVAPQIGLKQDFMSLMHRIWAPPDLADLLRLALPAAADLRDPLVLVLTGSDIDLPEDADRLAGGTRMIVCRVPTVPGDVRVWTYDDVLSTNYAWHSPVPARGRPFESFWNERRVLWDVPEDLPPKLTVRCLLRDMRAPGVPGSAVPAGHIVLQAAFASQPVVTVRRGAE